MVVLAGVRRVMIRASRGFWGRTWTIRRNADYQTLGPEREKAMSACAECGKTLVKGEHRVNFAYFVDGLRVRPVKGAQVEGPFCVVCYRALPAMGEHLVTRTATDLEVA